VWIPRSFALSALALAAVALHAQTAGAAGSPAQGPAPSQPASESAAVAQPAPGPTPAQPSPGLETPWEIAPVIQEIGAHAGRLLPELDKINVKDWVAQGASETYLEQWQSVRDQARAVADEAPSLARNPERLDLSLELLFRIQGLDVMIRSLQDGIRKYQGSAEAQQLAGLHAENGANRDRFIRYILNLAAERERQLQVMDREAQRCRGTLIAPPPPHTAGRKK
jgi:hypothetical protein